MCWNEYLQDLNCVGTVILIFNCIIAVVMVCRIEEHPYLDVMFLLGDRKHARPESNKLFQHNGNRSKWLGTLSRRKEPR